MGVGLSEFEEPLITGDGVFEVLDLIAGDITHNVAAPLPALMVVIVAVGPPVHPAELALFHPLDLSNLLNRSLDWRFMP